MNNIVNVFYYIQQHRNLFKSLCNIMYHYNVCNGIMATKKTLIKILIKLTGIQPSGTKPGPLIALKKLTKMGTSQAYIRQKCVFLKYRTIEGGRLHNWRAL